MSAAVLATFVTLKWCLAWLSIQLVYFPLSTPGYCDSTCTID